MNTFLAICVGLLIMLACIFLPATVIKYYSCHAKYSGYGNVSYGPIQGCMVTLKDGRTIPVETIREF